MTENENINQMPSISSAEEVPNFLKNEKWWKIDIENDFLDFEEPYRPPRYTLSRMGVPFANVGELHIISGKPGNGKTGLMSQLEAATLGRQFGNTLARDVGHIVRDKQGDIVTGEDHRPVFQQRPTRILHIDTEQGKDDTIAFKNRVISMSGMPKDEAKEHFFILRLRDTELASDRWKKILKAIYVVQPTDIFLDGMLDIVEDYNDQKECQPIIRKCMMLATYYDTSLWAVLHENPMVDKLVGTLGSITQRKVSEIFTVKKIKQGDLKPTDRRLDRPDIYFQVKQVKARGRDVADWDFQYITNAGGWGQPVELGEVIEEDTDKKAIRESIEIFHDMNWTHTGVTYSELSTHLTKKGFTNDNKRKKVLNTALDCQVVRSEGKQGHRKFFYNGYNQSPEDTSQAIPFEPNNGNEEAPF